MNKINPYELTLTELINLFRQLELINFQQFQTSLYGGSLELYMEDENE